MANFESDTIAIVRAKIGDYESCSKEYTDDRLLSLIYVAAFIVNGDLSLSYEINLSGQTISPSPSEDSNFVYLTALKAACMLIRGEQTSYSKMDFRVTDGPSTVDIKDVASKIKIAADTICGEYDKARFQYLSGSIGGVSILTPNSGS